MQKTNNSFYIVAQESSTDLSGFNEMRKQKYKLRTVLKSLDINKNCLQSVDIFLTIAQDNNIELSGKDVSYLKHKVSFQGKINYEEVVKDLALIAVPVNEHLNALKTNDKAQQPFEAQFYWILRQNNQELLSRVTKEMTTQKSINLNNLVRIKKTKVHPSPMHLATIHERNSLKYRPMSATPQRHGMPKLFNDHNAPPHIDRDSLQQQHTTGSQNEKMQGYLQGYSSELQGVLHKILIVKNKANTNEKVDWSKTISAASKKINILKNIQNKLYIKSSAASEKIHKQKDRIRKYMKDNEVDIMHLQAINDAFLDCDDQRHGIITKKNFLMQIADHNLQFPADFLFNLILDIQEKQEDQSEDANLLYTSLRNIIEIYSNCPLFLKGDSNNSDNFKANMDFNKEVNSKEERGDKLLKYVHARIEEKFKDFRQAFRNFDRDFGGSLDFKEFIQGMECIGVKLKLDDYRLIFEMIDYDHEGSVDFGKFCLLNTDKKHDLQMLISKKAESQGQKSTLRSKKPPLAPLSILGQSHDLSKKSLNPLFGDGNIPKNKDMNNFTKDIQSTTPSQAYISQKRKKVAILLGFKTYSDIPEEQPFGAKIKRNHDMVALLRNSYQEDISKATMSTLRSNLQPKKLTPSKPTYAQQLRDKMTKLKYQPLCRSTSASESVKESRNTKRRGTKMFMIKGNNKFNQTMIQAFNSTSNLKVSRSRQNQHADELQHTTTETL